jgi:ABC-type uncharacterized transport system substrate-binding protein
LKRILLSIILLFFAAVAIAADIARIDIIIPSDNVNLRTFSQKIQSTLQQQHPSLTVGVRTRAEAEAAPTQNTLSITVGDSLLPWALAAQKKYTATIAFYVNSAQLSDNRLGNNITALYRDQPLARQLRLAKLLFPKLHRVAILQGEQNLPISSTQLQSLSGLEIAVAGIREQPDWAKSLSQLMVDNDILLGVDDPQMYNSETIHSILLTAYRHGKVLIGPSKPFVGAGGLASCYTSNDQYLQQLIDIVKTYLQTEKLPAAQYPKTYQVTINQQVATSLGLTVPDEQTLSIRMQNATEECGDDC